MVSQSHNSESISWVLKNAFKYLAILLSVFMKLWHKVSLKTNDNSSVGMLCNDEGGRRAEQEYWEAELELSALI